MRPSVYLHGKIYGRRDEDDHKLVGELQVMLLEKKVTMELSAEARDWLAEHGFDVQFGARPMARLIQQELKKQLADELLFGKLKGAGGKVRVEVEDGKLALKI